jgi:hypothetical protein
MRLLGRTYARRSEPGPVGKIKVLSREDFDREVDLDRQIVVSQLEHGPLSLSELADLVDNNEAYTSTFILRPLQSLKTESRIVHHKGLWHLARCFRAEVLTSCYSVEQMRLVRLVRMRGQITEVDAAAELGVSATDARHKLRAAVVGRWLCSVRGSAPVAYVFAERARKVVSHCAKADKLEHRILVVVRGGASTAGEIATVIGGWAGRSETTISGALERIEACTGLVRRDGSNWFAVEAHEHAAAE